MSAPRFEPELVLDLSEEEILEDLCWPHPPPGRWDLYSANGVPLWAHAATAAPPLPAER
jgi:hypothetical protein